MKRNKYVKCAAVTVMVAAMVPAQLTASFADEYNTVEGKSVAKLSLIHI